ncbi:MAG: carbohydrate-binding family 9-like protein, partial [Ignavibacteria bacterium]|nr:carbohydrate-binding family 9-like protein [Ignavibacteria bacterium]
MKLKIGIIACIALCTITCSGLKNLKMGNVSEYKVVRLEKPMTIDGNWNKPEWQRVEAVKLKYFMGEIPKFRPVVKSKMIYDANNLYVIFRVEDRYIRCITKQINGPVWDDSCVELFFSPDSNSPNKYFNLEINCGGTPLMYY